jgi:hypothetical protein
MKIDLECGLQEKNPFAEHWGLPQVAPFPAPDTDGLDEFLARVRSCCSEHAERKGYIGKDGKDIAGEILKLAGVAVDHDIGEVLLKIIEFKKTPRRVIAEKIAGWAWRLWLTANE